jgi:outer membrane lipoprotein LolB
VRASGAGRVLAVLGVLLLAACAPVRVRQTPDALAAQSAREAQLSGRDSWRVSARVFVSDGGDNSGSGDLDWRQAGGRYEFVLRAPTGRTWKLSGDDGRAELSGVDPQPIVGTAPAALLRERLGWDVPLAGLSDWIRGMRHPGARAELTFDALGLPARIEQDGWTIDYREWFADRDPPLPRKVYASRGRSRVRLAIERWTFDG